MQKSWKPTVPAGGKSPRVIRNCGAREEWMGAREDIQQGQQLAPPRGPSPTLSVTRHSRHCSLLLHASFICVLHSAHQCPRAGLCCLDLHAAKAERQWMSSAKWLVVFQHRRPENSFALPMILISHLWCVAGRGLAQPAEQEGPARGWCPKHSLLGWC